MVENDGAIATRPQMIEQRNMGPERLAEPIGTADSLEIENWCGAVHHRVGQSGKNATRSS